MAKVYGIASLSECPERGVQATDLEAGHLGDSSIDAEGGERAGMLLQPLEEAGIAVSCSC